MPVITSCLIPARYLLALVRLLEQHGVPTDACLSKAGLDKNALYHPEAMIERSKQSLAVQALAQASQRADIGFDLGLTTNIATAGSVGNLLLSAATLTEGMARTAEYFSLITPSLKLKIEQPPGQLSITGSILLPMPYEVALVALESMTVALYRVILFMLQEKSTPSLLYVSWSPTPQHAARYSALKGAKVHFGQGERPQFRLVLPIEIAEAPLPMANPLAYAQAENECRRLLEIQSATKSWIAWVSRMLECVDGHLPTQAELARSMNVSARTLARSLAAEGISYSDLSRQVRHERAVQLLCSSDATIAEVAQRLGYSDAANFSRAFRAIAGMNPGHYRDSIHKAPK